jgi:hypothetical protein
MSHHAQPHSTVLKPLSRVLGRPKWFPRSFQEVNRVKKSLHKRLIGSYLLILSVLKFAFVMQSHCWVTFLVPNHKQKQWYLTVPTVIVLFNHYSIMGGRWSYKKSLSFDIWILVRSIVCVEKLEVLTVATPCPHTILVSRKCSCVTVSVGRWSSQVFRKHWSYLKGWLPDTNYNFNTWVVDKFSWHRSEFVVQGKQMIAVFCQW